VTLILSILTFMTVALAFAIWFLANETQWAHIRCIKLEAEIDRLDDIMLELNAIKKDK